MFELLNWDYWVSYLVSLLLSIVWNFTINRKITFKSANNIKVAMLGAYFNPVHSNKELVRNNIEYFKEHLRLACELNCKYVGTETGSYNDDKWTYNPKNQTEEGYLETMKVFHELAKVAKEYNCSYKVCDVSNYERVEKAISEIVEEYNKIDVLINNFGISNPAKDLDFSNTDTGDFLDTVNINLRSVFMASKEAVKYMAKQGGGSIINISSVGGIVPDISQVAYGTSKAAINYLTKLIAVHEAKNNIRCNAVLPGMTATDSVQKKLSDDFRDIFLRHIPFNRMGKPDEIAAAAVYFASDDSAYTTGQILTVSGGFGLATPLYGDLSLKTNRR